MMFKGKIAQTIGASALTLLLASNAHANLLTNGGFGAGDATGGDIGGATGWNTFENVFTNANDGPAFGPVSHNAGDNQSLKMFGPFTGTGNAAGAFQNVPGTAGTTYNLTAQVMNWIGDPFGNLGILQLNFLDSGGNSLGGSQVTVDPFGTADVDLSVVQDGAEVTDWTQLSVTGVAPAGTVDVQAFLLHIQTGSPCCAGGSLFWDDVDLQAQTSTVPVPAAVWLFGSGILGLIGVARRKG